MPIQSRVANKASLNSCVVAIGSSIVVSFIVVSFIVVSFTVVSFMMGHSADAWGSQCTPIDRGFRVRERSTTMARASFAHEIKKPAQGGLLQNAVGR